MTLVFKFYKPGLPSKSNSWHDRWMKSHTCSLTQMACQGLWGFATWAWLLWVPDTDGALPWGWRFCCRLSGVISSSMGKKGTNIYYAPVVCLEANMLGTLSNLPPESHTQSCKTVLFPFYRQGNWGLQRGNGFPKGTLVKSGKVAFVTRYIWSQNQFS